MIYQLIKAGHHITIERDGDDWRAMIRIVSGAGVGTTHSRYFSVHRDRPDLGLLNVTRRIRQDFGITGTYERVA